MSRQYTTGRADSGPSWREVIRARARTEPGSSAPLGSSKPPIDADRLVASRAAQTSLWDDAPKRADGERYVERDDDVDDFGIDADEGIDSFALRVGMRVRHPKFGVGDVHSIGAGSNPSIAVKFPGWGVKRIKLSFLAPA
jgi:hypothetical protein